MPECPSCGATYSGSACPYCARRVKDGDAYIPPKPYARRENITRNGQQGFTDEFGNFFPYDQYVGYDEDRPYYHPPVTDVPLHGHMKGTPMREGENPMLSRLRRDGSGASNLKTTMAILSPKASQRMAERYDREYDYRFGYRPPVTAKSVIGCLVSVAAVAAIIVWLVLRK